MEKPYLKTYERIEFFYAICIQAIAEEVQNQRSHHTNSPMSKADPLSTGTSLDIKIMSGNTKGNC